MNLKLSASKINKRGKSKSRTKEVQKRADFKKLITIERKLEELKNQKQLHVDYLLQTYPDKSIEVNEDTILKVTKNRYTVKDKSSVYDELGKKKYLKLSNITYTKLKKHLDKDILDALFEEQGIVLTSSKESYKII